MIALTTGLGITITNVLNYEDIVVEIKIVSSNMANKVAFHWEPPPPGWIKFNVAGVALEDEAGYGGVLSDDKGVACALFSKPIVAK
ncbi:hypothetical protein GOBAR_AA18856 [Gossypium barbadense]|uniref:RNase H type-1 domain-containing protein n=1 Tax=Gossypium barbadense TaxID=3634 RepID=A0A2P5XER5_GOSBA|nr:hypothetical protein GOBAR_AA18856 [Gossypium barbadense]